MQSWLAPSPLDHHNNVFLNMSRLVQVVWITVIVGLLAITLSTSNQDSLQNGLVECVGGVFLITLEDSCIWCACLFTWEACLLGKYGKPDQLLSPSIWRLKGEAADAEKFAWASCGLCPSNGHQ